MSIYTAQDFLRELWPVIEETPAGNIASRIAEREHLTFGPCDTCHGDGTHETWCIENVCDFGHPSNACTCEERFES